MIGPKATRNFTKTLDGLCSIVSKELKYVIVKYEYNDDWSASRMSPHVETNKL